MNGDALRLKRWKAVHGRIGLLTAEPEALERRLYSSLSAHQAALVLGAVQGLWVAAESLTTLVRELEEAEQLRRVRTER